MSFTGGNSLLAEPLRKRTVVCRDTVRRRKETDAINDLGKCLPLQNTAPGAEGITHCAILRAALQYVQLKKMVSQEEQGIQHRSNSANSIWSSGLLHDKKAFFLIVCTSGTIMYASEQITEILGPLQVDTIGTALSDVVHHEDRDDVPLVLAGRHGDTFAVRMANNLSVFLKKPEKIQYKAMYLSIIGKCKEEQDAALVIECRRFLPSPFSEITINDYYEYILDGCLNFLDVGWKSALVWGFSKEDLIGTPSTLFIHPDDCEDSETCKEHLETLLREGVLNLEPYRCMNGFGEWIWAVSEVTIAVTSHGKFKGFKGKEKLLGKYEIEGQQSVTFMDYNSLPTLSDLPTLSPLSVGSSSVHSRGHVSSSTEPLSDLSVEDILGQPLNGFSKDSCFAWPHNQANVQLSYSIPYSTNMDSVTDEIIDLLILN